MALQVKRVTPKRVFPPPKAAAPVRGRRLQILEKAAAAEKADKKKRAAAERRRLKALEKKETARRAARQAALKAVTRAALLPLVIARDGVREFAGALYRPILDLCKRTPAAVQLAAKRVRAALRRLDPRPGLRHLATLVLAFVAWLPRLNPLPYLAAFAGLIIGVIIGTISAMVSGAAARIGAALGRGRNFVRAIFAGLSERVAGILGTLWDYLRPRQLLSYSYAAAIGASLVVVGGQIALQITEDMEEQKATEEMASYQTANNVPAETAAATAILQEESVFFVRPPLVYDLAEEKALATDPAPEPLIQAPANSEEPAGLRHTEPNVRSAITSPAPAQATPQAKSPAARSVPDKSTAYAFSPARPVIAVVIDDMGMVQGELKRFATLPAAVTFAFLPYSPNLAYQTRVIRDNGHEMIVHLPMEPKRRTANPGPQALLTRLSDGELRRRIAWNLGRFEGFSGINNHMGSRFTEDPRVMRAVMSALKTRGLYFLDSMTTAASVGIPLATEFGVPRAQRDIFLDNKRDYGAILGQLRKAERIAERRGHVIVIGHPHRITYQVLKDWAPTLKRKGIRLVALSALIERPAPDLQIAENSVVTELSRDMPATEGRAIASAGAGGLH